MTVFGQQCQLINSRQGKLGRSTQSIRTIELDKTCGTCEQPFGTGRHGTCNGSGQLYHIRWKSYLFIGSGKNRQLLMPDGYQYYIGADYFAVGIARLQQQLIYPGSGKCRRDLLVWVGYWSRGSKSYTRRPEPLNLIYLGWYRT